MRVTNMRWRYRKRDLRKESYWMRMLAETGMGSLTRALAADFLRDYGPLGSEVCRFAQIRRLVRRSMLSDAWSA